MSSMFQLIAGFKVQEKAVEHSIDDLNLELEFIICGKGSFQFSGNFGCLEIPVFLKQVLTINSELHGI